jgi:hypothetical protein
MTDRRQDAHEHSRWMLKNHASVRRPLFGLFGLSRLFG